MTATEIQELYSESSCYVCMGVSDMQALELALLARWSVAEDSTADTTAQGLLDQAACANCYTGADIAGLLELGLLAQVAGLSGNGVDPAAILTEDGLPLLTEDGEQLLVESGDGEEISELPVATGANLDDLLIKVNDPSGSPATQKLTLTQLQTLLLPSGQTWDTIIVKSADQTVTNTITPQNDTELFTSLTALGIYIVEMDLLYSGNNTSSDYLGIFAHPNIRKAFGFYSAPDLSLAPTMIADVQSGVTVWPTVSIDCGTDAANTLFAAYIRFGIIPETSGTLNYQFCNQAAALGRDSTTRAGTTMRIKRLA